MCPSQMLKVCLFSRFSNCVTIAFERFNGLQERFMFIWVQAFRIAAGQDARKLKTRGQRLVKPVHDFWQQEWKIDVALPIRREILIG